MTTKQQFRTTLMRQSCYANAWVQTIYHDDTVQCVTVSSTSASYGNIMLCMHQTHAWPWILANNIADNSHKF